MNEEVIFDRFPGIENVIVSDVVRAASYLHSRDIIHWDTIPANILVSNFYYKSYKCEESEMGFGKKTVIYKLGDLGEARSMNTQTNALTGRNCTTAVHRRSLAFMVPELIIEELSIASTGIDELSMTFFTILNPDQTYSFQIDLKNIAIKVTSNMEAASACPQ